MRLQSLNQMQLGQPWPCYPPAVVIGSKGLTTMGKQTSESFVLAGAQQGPNPCIE